MTEVTGGQEFIVSFIVQSPFLVVVWFPAQKRGQRLSTLSVLVEQQALLDIKRLFVVFLPQIIVQRACRRYG